MSASAVSVPSGTSPHAVPQIPDFSERLSPMLVKELRQGMRSPVFIWGLIAMNIFLAGVAWLTVEDPTEQDLHQAFFGAYCVLVCNLLPLRAAGALHDELKGNTIDTLILTRLTGWRITLGKWVAVVAQQILAAVTVLPYLIVRYFAGGLDIPMEIAWLAIFLALGMVTAAVLTGFSWIRYFLFRAAIMMGVTFAVGAFWVNVVDDIYRYSSTRYLLDDMYRSGGWQLMVMFFIPMAHLAFFALDLGAARVGSMVENRSIRRRLTGAAVILLYIMLAWSWDTTSTTSYYLPKAIIGMRIASVLISGTLFVLALQALLEIPVNLVSVVIPWVKRGKAGRFAGRFLYGGWASGLFYISALLLVAGAALGCRYYQLEVSTSARGYGAELTERVWAQIVAGPGVILAMMVVPLVLWRLFLKRRLPWHLGIYALILGVVATLQFVVIAIASAAENPNILKAGLPIPSMSWSWMSETVDRWAGYHRQNFEPDAALDWGYHQIAWVSGCVTLGWWLLALVLAVREYRITTEVENEAALLLASGKATEDAQRADPQVLEPEAPVADGKPSGAPPEP